jgi:putative DNA primase/helicase
MNGQQPHFATLRYLHPDAASVLPPELRAVHQWVGWKAGSLKQNGKFDKYPKGRDGSGLAWQQPVQWASFAVATSQAKQRGLSGVGVVLPAPLSDGGYLVAMDFDDVDLETTLNNPRLDEIRAIHERLNNPYIERSPSGRGLRMFVRSRQLVPQLSRDNPLGGKDEVFCESPKWVTVTAEYEGGDGVPDATEELIDLISQWQTRPINTGKSSSLPITGSNPVAVNRAHKTLSHLAKKGWSGWPVAKLKDNDGREATMLSYAGYLRTLGHSQADIEKLCLAANAIHYADPLEDEVVLDRARRYQKHDAGSGAVYQTSVGNSGFTPAWEVSTDQDPVDGLDVPALDIEDRTDAGNVAVLARLTLGDLRYVPEQKQWLYWNKQRWNRDPAFTYYSRQALRVADFYKNRADKLRSDAESTAVPEEDKKRLLQVALSFDAWALQCRNKSRLDAMRSLAQMDERYAVSSALLDVDPHLFGVDNGLVDLRTGLIRPNAKTEFVLKRSSVDYRENAVSPRWLQFVSEITSRPGDVVDGKVSFVSRPKLQEALQRLLGYCLTGHTDAQKLFMFLGVGSNGKNVLLDTVMRIVSDYGINMPPEIILTSKFDRQAEQASPMARMLQGIRLTVCSESKDGQQLDTGVVKRITGGGYLTARGLHEMPVSFLMTHKLILMTNHQPGLAQMDPAIRGRLFVVPFDMRWNRPGETDPDPTLPDADPKLMALLWEEREGILQWLIEGAVKYHTHGLLVCPEVAAFTRDYVDSQDVLSRWLGSLERCAPQDGLLAADLVSDYQRYCRSEDEPCNQMMAADMGRKLKQRGIIGKRTAAGRRYGLRPREDPVQSVDAGNPSKKLLDIDELLAEVFREE